MQGIHCTDRDWPHCHCCWEPICLSPIGTTSWQTTPSPLLHRNGGGWSSLQETLILYLPLPASLCKIKLAYCPAGYKMDSETLTNTGCRPSLNTLMWEPNNDSGVTSFLISNFASCLMNSGICWSRSFSIQGKKYLYQEANNCFILWKAELTALSLISSQQ